MDSGLAPDNAENPLPPRPLPNPLVLVGSPPKDEVPLALPKLSFGASPSGCAVEVEAFPEAKDVNGALFGDPKLLSLVPPRLANPDVPAAANLPNPDAANALADVSAGFSVVSLTFLSPSSFLADSYSQKDKSVSNQTNQQGYKIKATHCFLGLLVTGTLLLWL